MRTGIACGAAHRICPPGTTLVYEVKIQNILSK
jgi:hypothetical protein